MPVSSGWGLHYPLPQQVHVVVRRRGDLRSDRARTRPRRDAEARDAWDVSRRGLLFGADGPHHAEVLALVEEVERAIAEVVGGPGAEAAARLIVSGVIVELNRARLGRDETPVDERLDELVAVVLRGARHRA